MDIIQDGRIIGQAQVWQEGLYYRFDCRCQPTGMCRLAVCSDGKYENLGIPVPGYGALVLQTRIPAKKVPQGDIRIMALPISQNRPGVFVPVCPDKPFAYLSRLQNAYMHTESDQIGVIIKGHL